MRMKATGRHLVPVLLALVLANCASAPVTQENSVEGKIAHYAIKVQDAKRAIDSAVKQLEAQGQLPTAQAAAVIQRSAELDGHLVTLAELLKAYDAVAPTSPTATQTLPRIQEQLTRIAAIANGLLVPIQQEGARAQIADLTGALHQTLLTLSVELAKGVR